MKYRSETDDLGFYYRLRTNHPNYILYKAYRERRRWFDKTLFEGWKSVEREDGQSPTAFVAVAKGRAIKYIRDHRKKEKELEETQMAADQEWTSIVSDINKM